MEAVKLRKKVLSLERKIPEAGSERERSILIHQRNALLALKEARKILGLCRISFPEEAQKLPEPSPEEEIMKAFEKDVWKRLFQLRMERDRHGKRAAYYTVRYRKTKSREDRKKALISRYLFCLLRREVSILYAEILKRGGET